MVPFDEIAPTTGDAACMAIGWTILGRAWGHDYPYGQPGAPVPMLATVTVTAQPVAPAPPPAPVIPIRARTKRKA